MFRTKSVVVPAFAVLLVSAGCSHVGQDDFDTSIADLRSELSAQNSAIEENQQAIFELSSMTEEMRGDIASLRDEFQVAVEQLKDGIRFAAPVHFDYDRADIRPEDVPLLKRFASVINEHYPNSVVTVEGFADPAGSRAYNEQLSQHRAENVASFLKTEAGLMVAEIKSVGYGENRLVIEGAYGPGAYGLENRRVAFVVEQAGEIEEMEEEEPEENAEEAVTTSL
ncbi:MAG: OmpA family protein [Gemmatimonadota bacterium]